MLVTIEVLEGRLGVDDEGELARFVRVGYPGLVAALGLVAGDRGAAEDAVQEALARAVRAEGRGQCIESLPAWVRVVSLNVLRNRWRPLGRERAALRRLGERSEAGAVEETREALLDLRSAVTHLPRRQREAVVLHYRLGLSVAEVSTAMRVSEGTVKTLLSRGRSSLAATLGWEEPGAR